MISLGFRARVYGLRSLHEMVELGWGYGQACICLALFSMLYTVVSGGCRHADLSLLLKNPWQWQCRV